jgi:hypothetical protein
MTNRDKAQMTIQILEAKKRIKKKIKMFQKVAENANKCSKTTKILRNMKHKGGRG